MQVDKPETKEPVCDNTSENTIRVGQAEQAAEAAECRGQGSNWAAKGKSQHHQCSLPANHSSSCAPAQGPEPLTLSKAPLPGLQEHRLLQGLVLSTQMFLEG